LSPVCELDDRLQGDVGSLEEFAQLLGNGTSSFAPRRINASSTNVEKDVAKLVLSLVDLVRHLVERQAIRRVNAGSLTDEEVERMGEVFLKLDGKMAELRAAFGLTEEDLNLNLGPVRNLL
jgi:hypothetical protein